MPLNPLVTPANPIPVPADPDVSRFRGRPHHFHLRGGGRDHDQAVGGMALIRRDHAGRQSRHRHCAEDP
jgi:hypothetical protein